MPGLDLDNRVKPHGSIVIHKATLRSFGPKCINRKREKKRGNEWNRANISLSRRMGIGRADFAWLPFFLSSLPLYSRLSCSLRFQPGLRGRSRRQSGHAGLREGLLDCKGNRANVSRPRRGACTRLAKLLINAHGETSLFLSNPLALSPFFFPSLSVHHQHLAAVRART